MSNLPLTKHNYVLTYDGANFLRKYLNQEQQRLLFQLLQILDVDHTEFCQKYTERLNIAVNDLSELCIKLNAGEFSLLVDFPILTANSECMLELTYLYGLDLLQYATEPCWSNRNFITAIINNFENLYSLSNRKFKPVSKGLDSVTALGYIIQHTAPEIIDEELAKLFLDSFESKWSQLSEEETSLLLQTFFATPAKEYVIQYLIVKQFIEDGFYHWQQNSLRKQLVAELTKQLKSISLVTNLINNRIWIILELFPRQWWSTIDFVTQIVDLLLQMIKQGNSIPYVWLSFVAKAINHELLMNNNELTKAVLSLHPQLREHLPVELLKDRNLVYWLVAYDYAAAEYLDFNSLIKGEIIELLSINGLVLQYLSVEYQQDREVVKIAIQQNPLAFEFADLSLRDNDDFASEAIKLHLANYTYISERLKNSYELAYQTVAINGLAVQLLSDKFQQDCKIRELTTQNSNLN